MSNLNWLYAFIGGAIIRAGVAILFAPEKGEDMRNRIKDMLKKKGLYCCDSELDRLIEQLTEEVEK
jgi:gas vesicle protein